VLVAATLMLVPLAAQQLPGELAAFTAGHTVKREQITIGERPIDVTLILPAHTVPEQAVEVVSIIRVALGKLDAWLGRFPAPALTVIEVPWHARVSGGPYPGFAVTSSRWLSTPHDPVFERRLLAALAQQYALSIGPPANTRAPFEEGLALYLGARLIRDQLHSRNFETPRFFGGFIPFPLLSLLNSLKPEDPRPTMLRGDGATPDASAERFAAALQTFERHIGWPAFQQVLEQFVSRFRGRVATPGDLAAVASEVTGRDLSTFFEQGILDEGFDYAIGELRNERAGGEYTVTVVVRRIGAAPPVVSVPLLVRFADGSEVIERLSARDGEQTFSFRGPSPAVLASVDPDAVLLVDRDRQNNTKAIDQPVNRIGVRLALNWMVWLQDAMLAYTALL
jgi:hypothetical protein